MNAYEAIGRVVVGLALLALLLVFLQLGYEKVLQFFGYRRLWKVRHRYQRKLDRPYPYRSILWVTLTDWRGMGGKFSRIGGLEVPFDPRQPIRRVRWWGA